MIVLSSSYFDSIAAYATNAPSGAVMITAAYDLAPYVQIDRAAGTIGYVQLDIGLVLGHSVDTLVSVIPDR